MVHRLCGQNRALEFRHTARGHSPFDTAELGLHHLEPICLIGAKPLFVVLSKRETGVRFR